MKKKIFFLFLLACSSLTAQRFDVIGAVYENQTVETTGEIFVDLEQQAIEFKINGSEMTLNKVTFKKGEAGELKCYKESIDSKKRVLFSPNKDKTGSLRMVSHIMTYTVVQSFSNQKVEVIYHLAKKRGQPKKGRPRIRE